MIADAHTWAAERHFEIPVADEHACKVEPVAPGNPDFLSRSWQRAERSRETRWQDASAWLTARLRRRAFLVAKSLPVLPGRTVLELGAGSGIWTENLSSVFTGQNSLTAAIFNKDLARKARLRNLSNTEIVCVQDIQSAFSPESFDYVVSTELLADELCFAALEVALVCLKPGGQFLFFPRNQDLKLNFWKNAAFECGFSSVEALPSEVIPPLSNGVGHAIGLILERSPLARRFSTIISLRGTRPDVVNNEDVPQVSMATHPQLFSAVSVVVPCHNEEANISRLVETLLGLYGDYIHEIVIVDDNSTDRTAQVATALADSEPRVRLVRRKPPAGVGRALHDGYAAATGKYILSIDCDFITIVPEFKGLFDAVAGGCEGAIGSRFSSESALVGYPFLKVVCNRGYHLLLNLLLGMRVRDVSNNLKLYRADILKNLVIEEDHFAANAETGLKPLLQHYRVREVPTSWINRTAGMGNSSFSLLKVGPAYLRVLLRVTWRCWRGRYRTSH